MKYVISFLVILAIVLCAAFLPEDAPGGEFSLSQMDFSGITKIELTNCHNGAVSNISSPEDIREITAFLTSVSGGHPESGRGYYEGSYSLSLFQGEEQVFSVGFGDSDCFYTGKGRDGYPLRYPLVGMTIKETVVPFFSVWDESGFLWR